MDSDSVGLIQWAATPLLPPSPPPPSLFFSAGVAAVFSLLFFLLIAIRGGVYYFSDVSVGDSKKHVCVEGVGVCVYVCMCEECGEVLMCLSAGINTFIKAELL